MRVLVLSEIFPNPARPALGVFVERQMAHMRPYCQSTVVVPVRVFPHLRLFKHWRKPQQLKSVWKAWHSDLAVIPARQVLDDMGVYYPRYSSPPRQIFHGLWGYFAYPFVHGLLRRLHSQHAFDLIHAHYAVPSGTIALLAKRWMRLPVVLSVHGSDLTYTARQNRLGRAIVSQVFSRVDAIIANSSWTAKHIMANGGNSRNIRIVRLGAVPPVSELRTGVAVPAHRIVLLSVGYLIERKGHAFVLKAIRSLVDRGYQIHYIIVGDGPEWDSLHQLARDLGITDRLSFEGYKPHEEVWPYFAACDVFVLPSWDEAFGVAYIEALSLGKPVIGCAGGGGPQDLKELGDCIELVQPQDAASLEAALSKLIDHPERRKEMGNIGRRIVQSYYSWERNAAYMAQVYHQVLTSHE